MSKFRGIVNEHRQKEVYHEEQAALKEKYHIEDENVKVVETTHLDFAKFSVNTVVRFIKLLAILVILILAAIGLAALVFPDTRDALLSIFHLAAQQTSEMIGK